MHSVRVSVFWWRLQLLPAKKYVRTPFERSPSVGSPAFICICGSGAASSVVRTHMRVSSCSCLVFWGCRSNPLLDADHERTTAGEGG